MDDPGNAKNMRYVLQHELGCVFVVSRKLRNLVSGFTPVYDRLTTIRIRMKLYNINLIFIHALTEDKDDVGNYAFYTKVEVL